MPARTSTLSQGSRTTRESTHVRDDQQARGIRSSAAGEVDSWPSSQGRRLGSAVSPIGDHATATKIERREDKERGKDEGQTEGKASGRQTELEEVANGTLVEKDGSKGPAEAQVERRRAVREISPDEDDEDADLDILDEVDEDDEVGQEGEADSAAVQQEANAAGQNRQKGETSDRQMPGRTMSRRQNSLNDYLATLSVSPPPAWQNYAWDDPARAGVSAQPLFVTIPEEDEEADDEIEMQEGHVEGEERVTISQRRRRVRSVARSRASSSTTDAQQGRTRQASAAASNCAAHRVRQTSTPMRDGRGTSRDNAIDVDLEEGDKGGGTVLVVVDSEDEDSDAGDLRNGIEVLSVQPATTTLDHDHDRDGDDQDMEDEIDVTEPPFDELAPTQRSASPPATPAYARDLQRDGYQSFAEPPADVRRRSPGAAFALPEGSDEWDIPPEELDMAIQCSIEASLPLASQRQMAQPAGASRRSDRPGHQRPRPAPSAAARSARPGIQLGDGALAPGWQEDLRPPAAKKPLPGKKSKSKGKQPLRSASEEVEIEQQMSGGKDRSPSLTPEFNRALSGIFGVDPKGSPSPSGQARIPTYTNVKQSLIEKLGLADAQYSTQRSSSTPSSTSSGSLSSGKRRREGIYSPGGTHKYTRGRDKERSPSLGIQDIKEEEADLRVQNEQLDLPGLTNVDRIAETEDVKVLIGSELIYELVWQRFIVLAILRYHDTSNWVIDSLLSRPYFAVPWERLTDALRDAAKHAWGRYGSRDRQSSQPITERAWSQRLIGLPFVDGDAIVSSNGSRCDLCEKIHGDRVHYPTIKLKGHVYDDTTFEDVAYETKTMSAGSDCYKRAIEGHRLFHAFYRAFHAFETDHFGEHLQKSSALLTMVEDRDVNGVTAYFRDCYDTGDIVSGRRREGERSVQYDIISSIKIGYERYMVSWRLRPEDLGFQVGRLM